ncbi:MAG: Obg family GTPase CgtA [Candidatus Melainabacteria bacterium]|jgi:GTP-binding protein
MSKFVDLVEIEVESGNGGDGVIAWRREKFMPYGGPAGGDGGRGGSVWIQSTNSQGTLIDFYFNSKFKAQDGVKGASSRKSGKSAEDLIIEVPVGTSVYQILSNNQVELIGDLVRNNQKLLVAQGGKGGRGNQHFATSVKQAPHICEPGQLSQKFKLRLELKLVAHVGIIGLPNAGKSTLISRLSACKPKIADYPFTTLSPNLGIMKLAENKSLTLADIPGLIEGAAEGHGLGLQFLRHIERTKVLIHMIDSTTINNTNIEQLLNESRSELDIESLENNSLMDNAIECLKAYEVVRNELQKYNAKILNKRQIIVLNKIDSCSEDQLKEIKKLFLKNTQIEPLCISAITGEGLDVLKARLLEIYDLEKFSDVEPEEEIDEKDRATQGTIRTKEDQYTIKFDELKGTYRITSPSIESWARVTDFTDIDSVNHLFNKLKKTKLIDELREYGIKSGDTVFLGKREMIWSDFIDERNF